MLYGVVNVYLENGALSNSYIFLWRAKPCSIQIMDRILEILESQFAIAMSGFSWDMPRDPHKTLALTL